MIMQSLGQASGVPVQFSAPPPPTPVSMKVHFSLVLCMYVGLRVVVDVGVRAVVSCRFWKPSRAGEVLPKFSIESNLFGFLDYWMQSLSSNTVFPDYSHMQSLFLYAASVRGFQSIW